MHALGFPDSTVWITHRVCRVTPFTSMGHAREVTLQDMIRAARSTAQDPAKAFPDASEEEQNEIAMLQEQNLELMERLRATRRMHLLAERHDEDLHEDRGLPEPRRKLRDGQWTVEGWGLDAEKSDVVDVQIEGRERVHIRQCSGLGHPVLIRMHGIANQLCVEECSNVQIETDGVLNSIAVSQCSKVTLLIGAECPAILLKHVRGCDITLCPDNMDGAIDTVGCSSVRIHSIFRRGVLSLGPEDLKSAVASYNATIPVRFSSRMAEGEWITEARDGGELRGQVEVWWDSRAREILAEEDDA